MTATRDDGSVVLDTDHITELAHLLDLVADVLRHGNDDLRADIAARYHPHLRTHLIDALEAHALHLRPRQALATHPTGRTP